MNCIKMIKLYYKWSKNKLTEEKLLAIKNLFPLLSQYNKYEILYVQKITIVVLFNILVNWGILLQNKLKKNLNLKINSSVVKLE